MLDHKKFAEDVGRPLERKRSFRDASLAMHSALRALEDGSMDWDLVDKQKLFSQIEFLVKYMEHIDEGLRDVHYLLRRNGTPYYLRDGDGQLLNENINEIDQIVDCIIPREYRW